MKIKKEVVLLESVTIEPEDQADACIIWLHGLGADGNDFVDVIPNLGFRSRHGVRFIFPHAPHLPVTINAGMSMPAWYDIAAIDLEAWQDEAGIRRSEESIRQFIFKAMESGIPAKRIILVGFSQGGALALHTALRFEQTLGGVAALSTYLPLHPFLEKEHHIANKQLPIFMAHGLMDPIVAYWMGQKSFAILEATGFKPEWHAYAMGHTVIMPEIQDLGRWMQQQVG
jgi:phospholipase/carboxylesterase